MRIFVLAVAVSAAVVMFGRTAEPASAALPAPAIMPAPTAPPAALPAFIVEERPAIHLAWRLLHPFGGRLEERAVCAAQRTGGLARGLFGRRCRCR